MMQKGRELRFKSLSILYSALFLTFICFSCNQQETEWKGAVEKVNGVEIVNNPVEPIYGINALSLEEEICIEGEKNSDEPLFIRVRAIQVDDEGNIYVLDSSACTIKVFNKSGILIREFGKKGQGPGEFQNPIDLDFLADGNLVVCDGATKRILFFSIQGEFLKDISPKKYPPFRIGADSFGNIYGTYILIMPEVNRLMIGKFDDNLELITNLVAFEEKRLPRNVFDMQRPRFWGTVTRDGHLIWGIPSKYELHILNQDGIEVRKIIKDYFPKKITETEKEWLIKNEFRSTRKAPEGYELKFPKDYNPYQWKFFADDEGRIIIGTTERSGDGRHYYDIFDSDGRFITKILLRYRPHVWKKDKMYFCEEDEEGYQCVKRYKVTWNF